jgi:hypothetical protein
MVHRTHQGGVPLYTCMSSPIQPLDYPSLELYRSSVQNEWERCWNIVYGAQSASNIGTSIAQSACYEPTRAIIPFSWVYRAYIWRVSVLLVFGWAIRKLWSTLTLGWVTTMVI